MKSFPFATITELKRALTEKKISKKELLAQFLAQAALIDQKIDATLELFDGESIIAQAAQDGSLAGIPGLLKDNIAQKGRALTCGSHILDHYVAPYDATVTGRLKRAGAFLAGRANLDEFAMGSSTETSAFKKTKNPWDLSRVPGGSSGGSAAAVAAGMFPWALGSDTGGSVRQPAAFCGVVGVKPTYGLVSRSGLVAYASSLDQIGVFARTVADAALVLSVIAGVDPCDSTTLQSSAPDLTTGLDGKLPNQLTIGIIDGILDAPGMDAEISAAIKAALTEYEKMGAKIKKIDLPILDYATAAYFILSRAEAASNLGRFDGVRYGLRASADTLEQMYSNTRHDGFGTEVKTRIMVGNYVLSAGHAGDFYQNAKKVQGMIRASFIQAFKDVNLIIMPTHSAPPFTFGAFDVDKLQMDLQDYFTCPINLAGIPGVSIPCGFTQNKLPIGLQLLAPHQGEALMLKVAHAYEQRTPWHTMHPNIL